MKVKKFTTHKSPRCPECKARMQKGLGGGRAFYQCPRCGHTARANGHRIKNKIKLPKKRRR
jgi:tRNA(Ile2) C34 agmatinyltransferase TiaS